MSLDAINRCKPSAGLLANHHPHAAPHPRLQPAETACRNLPARLPPCPSQVGLWHQLLGSAPLDAHGGAIGEDHGSSLNLAVEAAAIAKAALAAPTIGKRASNVGFALAIGQLLHAAATGEQLGAAKRAAAEAAAAAGSDASPAGSSPPPEQQQQGGGSSSGSEGEGQGEERAQQGASPPGSSASPLAQEDNPLKEKPMPPGFGLRRISSSSLIPRAASAAVSGGRGWEGSRPACWAGAGEGRKKGRKKERKKGVCLGCGLRGRLGALGWLLTSPG